MIEPNEKFNMSIEKFSISRDPELYEAWPDAALAADGRLVCVFSECTHHGNRDYTRIMLADSFDRGRTWTPKRPLTEGTRNRDYYYNCARITRLRDGRLAVSVDKMPLNGESRTREAVNLLYFSSDNGRSWSAPAPVPLRGIVPDKLLELENGRWIYSAHREDGGNLAPVPVLQRRQRQNLERRRDRRQIGPVPALRGLDPAAGRRRAGRVPARKQRPRLRLQKGPVARQRRKLGRNHRLSAARLPPPVAGFLRDGRIMITYRFLQGGRGWLGSWCQNFFAALTDRESVLSEKREEASARILPVDFDRSPKSDLGYSGWVQFPDGELYIVNYIVDDAMDKGQIRGYSMFPDEFLL